MAKEIAFSKRAKISKAQQNTLLAVLGASLVLGTAISLTIHFINQISFNTKVIMAEDESIVAYSNIIKNAGVCEPPKGDTYTEEELKKCDPNNILTSQVPNTLRYNILNNIASNQGLNSVPRTTNPDCKSPITDKSYTYKDLENLYKNAKDSTELTKAIQLMKSCSALRVIPDALPAFKNEEALLASLSTIFLNSGIGEPETISPTDTSSSTNIPGLNHTAFSFSVNGDTGSVTEMLDDIERSIREINIEKASIEWAGSGVLSLSAQAEAYYTEASVVSETTKTITSEGK